MRPRQLQRVLTAAAGLLLLLQGGLLAWLWTLPPVPTELPPVTAGARHKAVASATTPEEEADVAVAVLDRLLAQRVTAAATRQGLSPEPFLPAEAVRQAALAAPDPNGPAVRALVDHYGSALAGLGETLDATSSPGTAGSTGGP